MLTELCQYLRNWFDKGKEKYVGTFKVENAEIVTADGEALPLIDGQYYRIIGSLLNDGVHHCGDTKDVLADEPEFAGAVWSMAVPPAVVSLDADIDAWKTANAAVLNSPYQSESFGGYSYSLRSGNASTGGSGGLSWQSQFYNRLEPWRKI